MDLATRLRWSVLAKGDFDGIVAWIKADDVRAAGRVGRRILDRVAALKITPWVGKPGLVPGTREVVVAASPYVVVYAVETSLADAIQNTTITILRVRHGAMDWPSGEER